MDKQTILKKHHDMWMYIAEVLRTNKEWQERYFRDPSATIRKLKHTYITLYEDSTFADIIISDHSSCYCCYYANNGKYHDCDDCAVVWLNDNYFVHGKCMEGEYGLVFYGQRTIEEAVDLCIKIANLPEREGV